MISEPTNWLTVTGLLAILQFVAATAAFQWHQRNSALTIVRLGIVGAGLTGAIVALLLFGTAEPKRPVLLGTWSTFSLQPSPSIDFGLESDWIKTSLVSLAGCGLLIALRHADSGSAKLLSDDAILTFSLLFTGITVFVLAPNLFQALLGWAAVGIATGVLLRLSHNDGATTDIRRIDNSKSSSFPASPTASRFELLIASLGKIAAWIEHTWREHVWQTLTKFVPNWIAEQIELLGSSSPSLRRLAIAAGAFAMLLTWLM